MENIYAAFATAETGEMGKAKIPAPARALYFGTVQKEESNVILDGYRMQINIRFYLPMGIESISTLLLESGKGLSRRRTLKKGAFLSAFKKYCKSGKYKVPAENIITSQYTEINANEGKMILDFLKGTEEDFAKFEKKQK